MPILLAVLIPHLGVRARLASLFAPTVVAFTSYIILGVTASKTTWLQGFCVAAAFYLVTIVYAVVV